MNWGGTVTNTNALRPCTEVLSLSGMRVDTAPAAGFAGPWDLQTMVTSSNYVGDPTGTTEQLCRTIQVNGGSISIDDPDGTIVGVGDGNSATPFRITDTDLLEGELTLGDGALSRNVTTQIFDGDCSFNASLAGTPRSEPCPPPPTPNDFEGACFVSVTQFEQVGCAVASSSSYIGECIHVSVNGTAVTVNDGMGRGLLTGTLEGTTATVSRIDSDGEYGMTMSVASDTLTAHASKTITSGNCNGSSFAIDFEGPRLPSPCSTAGGNFAGDWSLTLTYTDNGCQIGSTSICAHFYQNGNVVIDDENGFVGSVAGNRLTIHGVEEIPQLDSTYTTVWFWIRTGAP